MSRVQLPIGSGDADNRRNPGELPRKDFETDPSGVTTSGSKTELVARQNAAATADVETSSFEGVLTGKCNPVDLVCKFKQQANEIGGQLEGVALDTFDKAMDTLFNSNVQPLVDKVKAAASETISEVNAKVNATINHIDVAGKDMIAFAGKQAKKLANDVTHDIQDMVTKVVEKATAAVKKIEAKFYEDIQKLLQSINKIVQKGQCMAAGGAKQLQDQIYKLLSDWTHGYSLSSCWRSLGYEITKSMEVLTEMQLYNYHKKCVLLSSIKPTTPANERAQIYAQGQLYAAQYFCIGETAGAPAFQNWFTKEWLWWGIQYNRWKNGKPTSDSTGTARCRHDTGHTVLPQAVAQRAMG